jgi:hypothetical protein
MMRLGTAMLTRGRAWARWLLPIVLACLAACAGEPPAYSTREAFTDTRLLETRLTKGKSSVSDVKRTLGEPSGSGALYLPRTSPHAYDVLFYQDVALTDMKAKAGQIDVRMRQQILVVYIRDGVYDGFTWFSNAEQATWWVKDSLRGLQR